MGGIRMPGLAATKTMMKTLALAFAWLALAGLAAPVEAKIERAPWGETADHQKVDIYTLTKPRA